MLQALLCGRAQRPGFLSIDCGSDSATSYLDESSIVWISDANLMTEGEPRTLGGQVPPYNTMRLFTGNQSKYCYNLSNNAVKAGEFFLVRAWFWISVPLPYQPMDSNNFRFKLLIDADEWRDVSISTDTVGLVFYEIYTRALHSRIDVCLARSTPEGDAPFISSLELRPLPSSLSATLIMNSTNRRFINVYHEDVGVAESSTADLIRYPSDLLDRLWLEDISTTAINTESPIDTSNDKDQVPASVLQTAFVGKSTDYSISFSYSQQDVNYDYYWVIYFAEIDPAVNASGQRVFNISVNGQDEAKPIDVFAEVGAYASYEIKVGPIQPTEQGDIFFNCSASSSSIFPPFFSASELFKASIDTFSAGSSPSDGFGYAWLNCEVDTTLRGFPIILSINLSNYFTGGEIPETINTLTMLEQILLNGNDLVGSIPDMSDLASLKTLDLSNNKLSGSIPESLARLENLKVLNLENNNLTGEIPPGLLVKKETSTLEFVFSGNPLCKTNSGVACNLSSSKSKKNIGLIIGVVISTLLMVIIGIGLAIFCICKKKNETVLDESFKAIMDSPLPLPTLQEFTFQKIMISTNNFGTQLGKGGFGPVYRGNITNEGIVAIKVASNTSQQGVKEFLNEVDQLSRVHHKNLVRLLGYCKEQKMALVYEFMSNGSLHDCLHGLVAKATPLSWLRRLRILVDAAQGFDYLHHGCNPRIIHGDIKSSNILLNDKLEAKISDFGISRKCLVDESGAPVTTLMGSMGYIDPEYLSTMTLTEKVDIYSFGVVIFEALCGRKAIFTDAYQHQIHIIEWIKSYIDRGMINDIVDEKLHRKYDVSSIWKAIEVALACVELSSAKRPTMSDVYLELKEALQMEHQSDQKMCATNHPLGMSITPFPSNVQIR